MRILSPELAALPWEFLYDARRAEYVCLSTITPVGAYPQGASPAPAKPKPTTSVAQPNPRH